MTMDRVEIIEALRGHTTKRELDRMLYDSTAMLRARLVWLSSSEAERTDTREIPQKFAEVVIGIDWARHVPDITAVRIGPFPLKRGEPVQMHRGFALPARLQCSDRLKDWLTRA